MKKESKKKRVPKKQKPLVDTASDSKELSTLSPLLFPIIGLGASAGGLEALQEFFSNVPETSGMAYIVVVHLSPKQPSMMSDLLQRVTSLPVKSISDGEILEKDHVYVTPPGKLTTIQNGAIRLVDISTDKTILPIDVFLRSLARDRQRNAAGIILSGTGSDGSLGIKEIKSFEGLVLVQSIETAKYNGMLNSAISTGMVDMIVSPTEMPGIIINYFQSLSSGEKDKNRDLKKYDDKWLGKIFKILRDQVGHDFTHYKKSTILRRISRRMGLNQVQNHDVYIKMLNENRLEVEALFSELLIGVTTFFRDPESFENLQKNILQNIFENMEDESIFRVWIPGCSTGEEVYSMAIIIRECLDLVQKRIYFQIFGTDIDHQAIQKARAANYSLNISADVNSERLNRFFIKNESSYSISKEIRDCVVFSEQDIMRDPPFSRLDMLSCRNLLIYLNSDAQKKILPLFHYTLKPGGILILGSSESIGSFNKLFSILDNTWKIFKRREVPLAMLGQIEFPLGKTKGKMKNETDITGQKNLKQGVEEITQRMVLDHFSPPAVLVDTAGSIHYIHGHTGKYLEQPGGPPSQNILDMAREGLKIEIAIALRNASETMERVLRKNILIKTTDKVQSFNLHVVPVAKPVGIGRNFLVVFDDIDPLMLEIKPEKGAENGHSEQKYEGVAELERELQYTRKSLQTIIEELESSNEELKSTNEELQSANEELQSTNEENESSREELQSVNEELQTVNAELKSKVDELSESQEDMRNLLNSINIATIFVDNNLHVKRYTEETTKLINFIPSDLGRPINHVQTNLKSDEMFNELKGVIETLVPLEKEVETEEGIWYKMSITPYKTLDNRINGAVLVFEHIDVLKKFQEKLVSTNVKLENAWKLVRDVFDMNKDPLLVINKNYDVVISNYSFADLLKLVPEQLDEMNLFDIGNGLLNISGFKKSLENIWKLNQDYHSQEFEIDFPKAKKTYIVHCRIIKQDDDINPRLLLHFYDIHLKELENVN